jgi:hypothetical protein
MSSSRRKSGAVAFLCFGFLLAGCSPKYEAQSASQVEINLSKVGRAYMLASAGLKRPPKNSRELVPYLKELGESEEALRSPRDGEELVILWGLKGNDLLPRAPSADLKTDQRFPVLAYEKRGQGGSRWVLQVPNRVTLMTGDEIQAAYFTGGNKPPQ